MPKVSIIVPVYNVEAYLAQCIDSILAQKYESWELILVDDGSPDRCGEIIDRYAKNDSRIFAIHQENRGVSAARNAGLVRANGEYISFVDPDDWINELFLEKLVSKIESEEADIACCNWCFFEDNCFHPHEVHNVLERLTQSEWLCHIFDSPRTIWSSNVNKLFRRALIPDYFREGIEVGEDNLFLWQYNRHVKNAVYINEPLYVYRIRQDSALRKSTGALLKGVPVSREIIEMATNYGEKVQKLAEKDFLDVCLRCYFETKSKDDEKNRKSKEYLQQYLRQHFIRVMMNEQIYWKEKVLLLLVVGKEML